jgi:hypothetical protein
MTKRGSGSSTAASWSSGHARVAEVGAATESPNPDQPRPNPVQTTLKPLATPSNKGRF